MRETGSTAASETASAGRETGYSCEAGAICETGRKTSPLFTETESYRDNLVEVPSDMAEVQNNIEIYHQQSIDQILEKEGDNIPAAEKARIRQGVQNLEAVPYDMEKRVAGSYNYETDTMQIAYITPTQLERTTKHETNHFSSYNHEAIIPDDQGYTTIRQSGIRDVSWYHSNETGADIMIFDNNRGMNEGITTMFTQGQLEEINMEAAVEAIRQNGYSNATEVCGEMENLVGHETIAKAYYSGDTISLEHSIDGLGGEGTFRRLSKCIDETTYNPDPEIRSKAMAEAQELLARMHERKVK
ncbi:MAG: hypothetical protein IJ480_09855 [Clostridia bacterium]|nr:hypothetical protein [Clostridia bacterium]